MPPKCSYLSEYTDNAHTEVDDLSSRSMNGSNVCDQCKQVRSECLTCTFRASCCSACLSRAQVPAFAGPLSRTGNASMTQNNVILPTRPVRGLPLSQDRLIRNHTIPIILASWNFFKIMISYSNLGTRQFQTRLGRRICLFITSDANMAGYPPQKWFHLVLLKYHRLYVEHTATPWRRVYCTPALSDERFTVLFSTLLWKMQRHLYWKQRKNYMKKTICQCIDNITMRRDFPITDR